MKNILAIIILWILAFSILFNYLIGNLCSSDDLRARTRPPRIKIRQSRRKEK